jgi:hypothetical protein
LGKVPRVKRECMTLLPLLNYIKEKLTRGMNIKKDSPPVAGGRI